MPDIEQAYGELCQLAKSGDFDAVKKVTNQFAGTGLFPQRLALLEKTDADGNRPEDIAQLLADSSPVHAKIHEYLSSERVRMEYSE